MKCNETTDILIRPQWLQFWREILTYREKYLSFYSPAPNKDAVDAEIKKFSRLLTEASKALDQALVNEAVARAAYLDVAEAAYWAARPKSAQLFQAPSPPPLMLPPFLRIQKLTRSQNNI
jgi:hypothetical protein